MTKKQAKITFSTISVMSYFRQSYSTQMPMDTAGSVWKHTAAPYACTHTAHATPYRVLYLVF